MIKKSWIPRLPERITRNRVLNWVGKGSLIFMLTWFARLATSDLALAADPSGAESLAENPGVAVDYVWVIICAALVFLMQAGFAMVEAGFCRRKNTANLMMKNLMDFCMTSLSYLAVGFAFMFGADKAGIIGTSGWFLLGEGYDVNTYLLFVFQVMFAATAATIVAGAVAERIKWKAYFIYSIVVGAVIYPIYGHWVWGGGWLSTLPFGAGHLDFAGSGAVHMLGGFVGLAGAMVLGPRFGKYVNGKPRAIPGHSISLATLGTFLLWFGWFGFNAGSTLAATELRISVIATTTTMSAAAGAFSAMLFTWIKNKKPDVGMALNGSLAGLVAITAGCAWVSALSAVVIGAIAGVLVVLGVYFFDKIGIDDPVGAVSVHGLNGIWGLLAVGIFADGTYGVYTTEAPLVTGVLYGGGWGQLAAQGIGAAVCFGWALGLGLLTFKIMDKLMGIRVSPQEELQGLDISEHGTNAYPGLPYTEA
jgi:Amt family ammonium transporter